MNKVKSRVHRLPTKNQTHILVNTYINPEKHTQSPVLDFDSAQRLHRENTDEQLEDRGFEHQYLYATTDEEIKKGYWFLDIAENVVKQCPNDKYSELIKGDCTRLKITASNDPNLNIECSGCASEEITRSYQCKCKEFPQFPLSFIKDYCDKGGIDEVYLAEEWFDESDVIYALTSSNEVIIHPIEEKTYNREEVIAFGKKCAEYGYENELDNEGQLTDEFIDRNL